MKDRKRAMWPKGNDTNKAKTQNEMKLIRNDKFKMNYDKNEKTKMVLADWVEYLRPEQV